MLIQNVAARMRESAPRHTIPTSLRIDGVARAQHLDLRTLFARAEQPLDPILRALARLASDEALHLITPFEPRPLHTAMRRRGYSSYTTRGGADFHVWLYRHQHDGPRSETIDAIPARPTAR